jgi:hypothetical protein
MPRLSPWQPPAAVPETLDADALVARLATVPRLREHHLWEALRILPSLGKAREDIGFRRAFRMLMERDDLDGACRALIAAACPARRLDRLQALDGVWVARVVLQEDAPRRAVAVHGDRLAAVLAALVALDRAAPSKH